MSALRLSTDAGRLALSAGASLSQVSMSWGLRELAALGAEWDRDVSIKIAAWPVNTNSSPSASCMRDSWPRHPQPSEYRNPYVSHRGSRRTSETRLRGIRPGNLNAQRIVAAAESGKYKTMTCIANEIGVSRERVRQVLNTTGHTQFARLRLEWSCPGCGTTVSHTRAQLSRIRHMPAHCRECASAHCKREHLRNGNTSKGGQCLACVRLRLKRVVEVRTCIECGKDLEISQGTSYQIRGGRSLGKFHQECYFAYMRREGRPPNKQKAKAATA